MPGSKSGVAIYYKLKKDDEVKKISEEPSYCDYDDLVGDILNEWKNKFMELECYCKRLVVAKDYGNIQETLMYEGDNWKDLPSTHNPGGYY
jgi:hypothetical protein